MKKLPIRRYLHHPVIVNAAIIAVAILFVAGAQWVAARGALRPPQQASPLHPAITLFDAQGKNVADSGEPISTLETCGACHDTDFIQSHSFHSDLGLSDFTSPGQTSSGTPWDSSPGLFGKFDPLTYRYLSAAGDERLDLSTADWLKTFGARVVGSGPATTARDGRSLLELTPDAQAPEASTTDRNGQSAAWDWRQSGTLEMNCFLCHAPVNDQSPRTAAIEAGNFKWANTAALAGTGIVQQNGDRYTYNRDAFEADGSLKTDFIKIQDPLVSNCAQCHGAAHSGNKEPLTLDACNLATPQTATTGQVFAAQKMSESGVNLADKATLARSWDIHAERALQCTDCHYALNNPAYAQSDSQLDHLQFDPRRLDIGEYLQKPDHNFARGQSAQFSVAPELKGTMRRCESCHAAESTHGDWLPYVERHMDVVACETCHISGLNAPAIEAYDWTVIKADGSAQTQCRGIEGSNTTTNLVSGYQPVLMQRTAIDGDTSLAPYNLISTWFWVYDDANGNTRPVRQTDLEAAYLSGGQYAPEIVAAFDANADRVLSDAELKIDNEAKQAAVAARLIDLGLKNPRITGQVQPYSINHGVARGEFVTRECQSCHADDSRIVAPLQLSSYTPGGVLPQFVQDTNVTIAGEIKQQPDGSLYYHPATMEQGVYVFGRDRVAWIDALGALAFVGVLIGVAGHGTARFVMSLRYPKRKGRIEKVYMYDRYERLWHWLQTVVIILLLFTGLIIHRPDLFGLFSFPHMVTVHNVLAVILVINAGLSLFWHLASGQVKQFIPRPYGFFDQAIMQAKFYLQGIFKGKEHPFEKTREKKLNPLQQITYFGLLNVLLPLQIITGALMWGVQRWPGVAGFLGGLPVLAPFHTLVAWLFASFVVAHVYLTTTGVTPAADIRAMITGWEDMEVHGDEEEPAGQPVPPSPARGPVPATVPITEE